MDNLPLPFALETPGGATLQGFVDLPDRPEPRPTIVLCHGFKGFMEWGFHPFVAALLAARGFVAVRFNFSGAGMKPGDDRVTDEGAFRDNTHGRELAELNAVLEALGTAIAPGRIATDRLGLFGHSRGGGAAILAAAQPHWRERVKALVTWAAISRVDRYSDEQKMSWRGDGELPVVNTRTGQRLALGLALLEDLERHAMELDILGAAAGGKAPWLIVHGDQDESVPPRAVDSTSCWRWPVPITPSGAVIPSPAPRRFSSRRSTPPRLGFVVS
jgi:pimeloyl-ACP methyl ester carboxylesterase